MANLQFNCSACGQPIECDPQFAAQQLSCPFCQAVVLAPAPKPAGKVGLAVAAAPAHGTHAPTPIVIPPPSTKPKRKSIKGKVIGALLAIAVIAGLVVAFPTLKSMSEKFLNKTDEAAAGTNAEQATAASPDSNTAGTASASSTPTPNQAGTAAPSPNAGGQLAAAEPVHNLDIEACEIPKSKLTGVISSETFSPDVVRFDKAGPAYILQFRQGTNTFEREMSVILRPKPGQSIETNTWVVSKDMKSGIPQVTKKWKTGPRLFGQKSYSTGYAMKLEFGKIANGVLPGKIYVALPDPEMSVVAGQFEAQTRLVGASSTPGTTGQVPGL